MHLRTYCFAFWLLGTFQISVQASEPIVLKNSVGQLSVSTDGSMKFQPENQDCPAWKVPVGELWRIKLAKGTDPFHLSCGIGFSDGEGYTFSAGQNVPQFSKIEDGVQLTYDSIRHGKHTWDIKLSIQVKAVGDEFQFSAIIKNKTKDWSIPSFKLPVLFEVAKRNSGHKDLAILLPSCFGERVDSPKKFGKKRIFTYPSGKDATMQWCTADGGQGGLYFGCHDVKKTRKIFTLINEGNSYAFGLVHEPFCTPGTTWESAPVVVMPYEGTWHVAARRYRKWVDTWMPNISKLDWVTNENSGMFACIMKQQNGDQMYRYDELDKVADFADIWGLDVLGLFGWAEGGHDRSYPEYIPNPKLGGAEALKKAIRRVQKRGKKVVLYANGQLIDKTTDFYRKHAEECVTRLRDGTYGTQRYNKFKSTPDPTFVQACLATEIWYNRLFELGRQAQSLGADGILYDQLGVMPAASCYCDSHGHANPAATWAECRFQLVDRLTKALREHDPDFLIMTEGVLDAELGAFSYFHGCGMGAYNYTPTPGGKEFPEMFRYTFPEFITTQRNSNPMITRNDANLAFCYGLRHEVESRYVADVKYLAGQKIKRHYYNDCKSPPKVGLVCSTSLKKSSKYLRNLIALENRFSDFVKRGRFIDTEGFQFQGKNCMAKGYRSQDGRLGVVVWNYGKEPQEVKLSATGFQLENAFEPGQTTSVNPQDPILPESVRFYLWLPK